MLKRKVIMFSIFGILVFFSILNFLPVAHGINFTTSDAENDVIRNCGTGDETGDYHDEIDIVNLIVAGRNVNLTVAGNLAKWNASPYGSVIFSSRFMSNPAPTYYMWTAPYYAIDYDNDTGSMIATLEKGYSIGGGNFAYEVWNGTAWEDRIGGNPINIVVSVTTHSILCYIPDGVEELPSNMKALAVTRVFGISCGFIDLTPIPSDQGIPSYDVFVLICTMIGISFIIIKKYKKQKT
ncbi:MAG: hypothetical protein ACFFDH_22745 [Promethearchaeota archaeon]